MKINTTYGRSDIEKQQLELGVLPVGDAFAITARFNGNNTHRTVRLHSEKGAEGLMKSIAVYVKTNEFPWESRIGVRLWKQLPTHDLPF